MDDAAEELFDEFEDDYDEYEDSYETLKEASEEGPDEKRYIIVRTTPSGFTPAAMGEGAAVGLRVYTEGLSTCIGMLASGQVPSGETVNVLSHSLVNDQSGMEEQWKGFKDAVLGAGYIGVRLIMSSSNPDQLPESAAGAKDQMAYTNDLVRNLMTKLTDYEPEDYPHDGNKAHQLPHGTIKADGENIEVNGNRV